MLARCHVDTVLKRCLLAARPPQVPTDQLRADIEAILSAMSQDELASLTKAIKEARLEVSGLMEAKCDLQEQLAGIYSAENDGEADEREGGGGGKGESQAVVAA